MGKLIKADRNESTAEGSKSVVERVVSWLLPRLHWFFTKRRTMRFTACVLHHRAGPNGIYYRQGIRYIYKDCLFPNDGDQTPVTK